jgi:hypothetical protein
LLTADGHGTAEIMRRTGKAKTVIWSAKNGLAPKASPPRRRPIRRRAEPLRASSRPGSLPTMAASTIERGYLHPKVLEWLAGHPRFVFHFTPTSASWLNAVEGLFALLTKRRLKRGVFRSLQELKEAIGTKC